MWREVQQGYPGSFLTRKNRDWSFTSMPWSHESRPYDSRSESGALRRCRSSRTCGQMHGCLLARCICCFFFSPKQQSGESSIHLRIKRGEKETQQEDTGVVFFSFCNDSMWKSCPDTLIHIICAWSSNEIHVLHLILVLQMWKHEWRQVNEAPGYHTYKVDKPLSLILILVRSFSVSERNF